MSRFTRILLCLTLCCLPLAAPATPAAETPEDVLPPNRAYAFGNDKISIINEDNFESLGQISLPKGRTAFWWNNAAQDRLALIIQDGIIGNKPVTLVVIDLETDKVVNTVKLGYDAVRFMTSNDGNRGYLVLGGKTFRGKNSVVVVDAKSGKVVAQKEIKKQPKDWFLTESGDGLVLVDQGLNALKASQRRPGTLEWLDSSTLDSKSKVSLPGPVEAVYLDYPGRVYVLNRGVDHKSKKSQAQGEIYVLDRETLELNATFGVGMAPTRMAWDSERERFSLLTSPSATRNKIAAQLHLIDGDGIAASIELPRQPLGAQPSLDRESFYVLYKDEVVQVDSELEEKKRALALKDSPVQLFEHPDNNHFYAMHFDSSEVSIVDGASGKTKNRVKTGRNTARATKLAAAAGAQLVVAGLVVATGPSYTIDNTSYYHVPVVNPMGYGSDYQRTFGTFSKDARYLFVYNLATDDVSVIDTTSHKIVSKLAGGEYDLQTLGDGRFLSTVSAGYGRIFEIGGSFEKKGTYDGVDIEFLEIPGKNKAYFSRGLGKPVSVIDFNTPDKPVSIPGTSGKVIELMEYN